MTTRLRLGSRRRPYPFRAYFAGIPVMFARDPQGVELYSKKELAFEDLTPTILDYATQSPYKERDFPFRFPYEGVGEAVQIGAEPSHRSLECINVDTSLGFAVKGPYFHDAPPANLGQQNQFVEALYGGVPTLFALSGRYVNRLQPDDTWTLSKDLGAGVLGLQGCRFKDSGSGVDGLYIANTGAAVQQFDGAAWNATAKAATAIASRREELWYGLNNTITKVTADPTVGGNFSAPIVVGDGSSVVNWLSSLGTNLVIFKSDGIYGLDVDLATGNVVIIPYAEGVFERSAFNGLNSDRWLGYYMFSPIGGALYRLELQIAFGVPHQLDFNPVPLSYHQGLGGTNFGIPVAVAGHNDWHLYVATYNAATGNSYIGKYGTWVSPELLGGNAKEPTFIHAWHCAIAQFTGKHITSMGVWGRSTENQRLWVGFADGDIKWAWLPTASPDTVAERAAVGGRCEFNTDPGWVRWTRHNAGFPSIQKLFRGVTAYAPKVDANNTVVQQYRVGASTDAPFTSLADPFVVSGNRENLPGNVIGDSIDLLTQLTNASIQDTPVVEGIALHEQLRPDETFEHQGVVDCSVAVAGRNGTGSLRGAEKLRGVINAAMSARGSVRCIMPDSSISDLVFHDHGENLADAATSSGLEWQMPFKAVEFQSVLETGTYRRLRSWTYRQLRAIRYRGLPNI